MIFVFSVLTVTGSLSSKVQISEVSQAALMRCWGEHGCLLVMSQPSDPVFPLQPSSSHPGSIAS